MLLFISGTRRCKAAARLLQSAEPRLGVWFVLRSGRQDGPSQTMVDGYRSKRVLRFQYRNQAYCPNLIAPPPLHVSNASTKSRVTVPSTDPTLFAALKAALLPPEPWQWHKVKRPQCSG
ncbi:unnamed protein product [Boreogadus saida]